MENSDNFRHAGSIGFIGGGNMASAIIQGVISKDLYKPSKIWVSGPHPENLSHLKSMGVNITCDNGKVVRTCDSIFLSVKPHMLNKAVDDCVQSLETNKICPEAIRSKLFISILAGTSLFKLETILKCFDSSRVIRVMPNTPMLLGMGACVYSPGSTATSEDCTLLETILGSCGIFEKVPEHLINAVGGLSGSGPAFVYMMIEAMSDGGVKQGISRPMAVKFAAQTVLGAAKMVLESGKHAGQLKDEVCSAGGSTICGVHALEKGGARALYMDAIEAAVKKSIAMGQEI